MSYRMSYVLVGIVLLFRGVLVAGPREQLLEADELDDIGQKLAMYGQLCECNHTAVRIDAVLRLAWIYQCGYLDVMPRDAGIAVSYWTLLAQQNVNRSIKVQAYEILGDCYRDGWMGNAPNLQEAKKYLRLARDECPEADLDIKRRAIEKLEELENMGALKEGK